MGLEKDLSLSRFLYAKCVYMQMQTRQNFVAGGPNWVPPLNHGKRGRIICSIRLFPFMNTCVIVFLHLPLLDIIVILILNTSLKYWKLQVYKIDTRNKIYALCFMSRG